MIISYELAVILADNDQEALSLLGLFIKILYSELVSTFLLFIDINDCLFDFLPSLYSFSFSQ